MESKLHIIRKKRSDLENSRLDPLMRALKALHSAGAPENMTAEELERQRRSQEVLGRLTAPMAGMDYEEFALSGMSAAWTRLKAPHGSRHAILYCHGGGYTSGNLGYSRVLSSKLAHATGYDVLSFEYRLAPEFPYPAAVEDARDNARRNGITNAEFFCGDAADAAQRFAGEGLRPDVICVDPPRKGLAPAVIDAMVQMAPTRIVYVSCDPATLARDLARLSAQGYRPQQALAVDMFPRTAHVETIVLLQRETL